MRESNTSFLLAILLLLSAVSCSVTTSSVEGTSDSFGHTTGASADLTEASTEVTSSTSPDGDSEDTDNDSNKNDSEAKIKEEARLFAERNFAKLRHNIAVGEGEYLTAVAEIFEVSEKSQSTFCQMAKTSYTQSSSQNATPSHLVEMLYHISKSLRS
jgi:hypothetical protein